MITMPSEPFRRRTPAPLPGAAREGMAVEEVAPGVLFFPYFGTSVAFLTDEGVVLFDTSTRAVGRRLREELRARTDLPIQTIVYSHGHLDHVGGAIHFIEEAKQLGRPQPRVIGQRRLVDRLRRYERMAPWLGFIGQWQWDRRAQPATADFTGAAARHEFVYPTTIYDDRFTFVVGGERFDLRHNIGETDDATWLWNPSRRSICAGDFVLRSAPNIGNPWKVQRYTVEWAEALEAMLAMEPELILPGHGPAVRSRAEISEFLGGTAAYLRSIHDQVVERMNAGQWLEQILHEVEPPAELAAKPWLQDVYGHRKFIVQGVWRQYGGWWDGNPADFFPARTDAQAAEIVGVAGAEALLARARELQATGELALACHLVDWVRRAAPGNAAACALWRDLFDARAIMFTSGSAREAEERLGELG